MKEKKKYTKPELKKNEPLVNITFSTATGTSIPGTGGTSAPAVG
ncbi:MAG: hypothetical protein R6V10_15525 [bacterium]